MIRRRALPLTLSHWQRWAVALVLAGSFVLKLPHLGHKALKPLDESFHAIVAGNFLKHPFTPTLDDGPHLDVPPGDWQNSHIWLHKPPMAMWQIAVSYAILGVNTFALRLPSAILATLAAGLTFLIGKELLDETAGLVAAALQAFNPVIAMIVHGYVFSDHVDISLLFWVEAGTYFLVRATRTKKRSDLILCGVAQGLALLSKSYPALIVSVLAIVAWIWDVVSRERSERSSERSLRSRLTTPQPPKRSFSVALILFAAFLTVFPWVMMCLIRWPGQFRYENWHALLHLSQDVEGWAAPWDRLVFDYWISIFHVYYPLVLVGGIVMTIRAIRLRDPRLWLILIWGVGVLVPHLIATSKTMTATLIGWPAMWLMVGYLVSQAVRGCGMSAGAWAAAVILPLFLLKPDDIPASGWGYPPTPGFGVIMSQHLWVLWFVAAALGAGVAVALLRRKWLRLGAISIAIIAMLILAVRWWGQGTTRGYAFLAWRVTQIDTEEPDFSAIGSFADKLPENSVFMVEEQEKLDNKLIQFAADRTCYAVHPGDWPAMGQKLIDAGALPYLVSARQIDELPPVFMDPENHRTLYACTPRALQAARRAAP